MRSKKFTVSINGNLTEVYVISGFARECDRSIDTIRRYERNGVIPPAFLTYRGARCYPVEFTKKVAPLIRRIPCNRKCPAELIVEINRIFSEEKSKYA